jgi:hypothetical protein
MNRKRVFLSASIGVFVALVLFFFPLQTSQKFWSAILGPKSIPRLARTPMYAILGALQSYYDQIPDLPEDPSHLPRVLTGKNAWGMKFLKRRDIEVDAQGQFLDPWQHPYVFTYLSLTTVELRSAGDNGKLYDDDDEVMTDSGYRTRKTP